MDQDYSVEDELVRLGRVALAGRRQDAETLLRRIAQRYRTRSPELSQRLTELVRESPTLSSPMRGATMAGVPVDSDTRLGLVRVDTVPHVDVEPIWSTAVDSALKQIIRERGAAAELLSAGLTPTRTILFCGAPGVGKTLAARWLAQRLGRPLLTLDLATVMSSFLGRTGSNLRHVMDYAKDVDGVLLLDEIDALAKRRDDAQEVGELKRLVTALLQEIDDWPATGLLLAATNHPDLLDPAAWRRFEMQLFFPLPDDDQVRKALIRFAGPNAVLPDEFLTALSILYRGFSFSDIERDLLQARRAAVLNQRTLGNELLEIIPRRIAALPRTERHELASALTAAGVSARKVQALTGTSRDTIRRRVKDSKES